MTEWEYGVRYNTALGSIHEVIINSWNRGIRVSVKERYPQGDNPGSFTFGTTVFTKGLDGQGAGWIQNYYQGNNAIHSNGNVDGVQVFRRRLSHSWTAAGTLAELEWHINECSLSDCEYGVRYNTALGSIHTIFINSWNRGVRVSVPTMYPQGDNAGSLAMGTTVMTKDTDGQPAGQWMHSYYQGNSPIFSNGNVNGVQLFRRFLPSPWVWAGDLAGLDGLIASNPLDQWQYGVRYNSAYNSIHEVVINSWNRGVRVTVTPNYPQGDNINSLEFGTALFTKDLDGQTPGQWLHNYYRNNAPVWSNGVADGVQVYRRQRADAWQELGTMSQLENIVATHPATDWTYGVTYNTARESVHEIFVNSWNRGIRVSAVPLYPQGDNVNSLTFGTTVFTKGCDGENADDWTQRYYQGNNVAWSNGNVNSVRVFGKRIGN